MSAPLSDHWTAAGVTVMPPGWLNITERADPASDGSLLTAAPCPAVLLLERDDGDGQRETKAVAATFVMDELEVVGPAHYATVTADQWEAIRADAERDVAEGRAQCKVAMLDRLVAAGDAGVTAEALIRNLDPHRALALRGTLVTEGLATTAWRDNTTALMGREWVYRLARLSETVTATTP